jgi:DNA-binding MarR family transcriptional regulator
MACQHEVAGSDYAAALELASRALVDAIIAATARMKGTPHPVHLRALRCLDGLGGGHVSALAGALDMLPSTASRLSDRLAAAGLITRTASPVNRRATRLELTAAGRAALGELARARTAALAEIVTLMSEPERAALLTGMRAFDRAAKRPRPEEGPGEAPVPMPSP